MHACPALMIAAPSSGQGKTHFTAALATLLGAQGRRVRVFKLGPDYLDPQILKSAVASPVYQLDLWMMGQAACARLLAEAASESDFILIESAMGLYDGEPSAADFAHCFKIPVLLLADAGRMAQSFAALVKGMTEYDPFNRGPLQFAAIIANRTASDRHRHLLVQGLRHCRWPLCFLPTIEGEHGLPRRHLGLIQAAEIPALAEKVRVFACAIEQSGILEHLPAREIDFPCTAEAPTPKLLQGVNIAVARDQAFSFIYPHNLDILHRLGAGIRFFSPLQETDLPSCDAVYLPGGYPELHLRQLGNNRSMMQQLADAHDRHLPMLAECGGMLYCMQSLQNQNEEPVDVLGLIPGNGRVEKPLVQVGYHQADLGHGPVRGHSFHHGQVNSDYPASSRSQSLAPQKEENIYKIQGLTASFVHWHFASNPTAAASFFCPPAPKTR